MGNPKTPIRRNGATVEEVSKLKLLFERAGMTSSVFYNRTTYVGFDTWEVDGINRCMEQYVQMVNDEAKGKETEEGEQPEPLRIGNMSPQDFRQALLDRGLWCDFTNYMQLHGMSTKTTLKRFYENSFAEWEMKGVERMMWEA